MGSGRLSLPEVDGTFFTEETVNKTGLKLLVTNLTASHHSCRFLASVTLFHTFRAKRWPDGGAVAGSSQSFSHS